MLKFDYKNIEQLKEFMYNSFIHDSKIQKNEYKNVTNSIEIELFNPIFNVKINLTFLDIEIALAIKGDWSENRETVVSLTVEEDFSYLQNYFLKQSKNIEDSIYLLFQMFSGDELHIVCRNIIVEATK